MSDAIAAVLTGTIEGYESWCAKNNVPTRNLLAGTGLEQLPPPGDYIPWPVLAAFTRNFYAALSDQEAQEVCREMMTSSPSVRVFGRIASAVMSPAAVYRAVYKWLGPRMYRNMSSKYDEQPDGTITVSVTLHDGQEGCREFFQMVQHCLTVQAAVISAGDATIVSSEVTERGIKARVLPGQSPTALARMRRMLINRLDPARDLYINLGEEIGRTHKEAQIANEGLASLFHSLPDGILIISEGKVAEENPAASELLGGKTKGSMLVDHVSPEERGRFVHLMENPAETRAECRFVTQSGNELQLEVRKGGRLLHERRPADFLILRDLSKVRHLEAKMSTQQRLAVLGELSASLAHEIANPLTVIKGSLENFLARMPDDRDIRMAAKHTAHMEAVLSGFRGYIRGKSSEPVASMLDDMVGDAVSLCRLKAQRNRVGIDAREIPRIELLCRPHEIVQALVNIISNAIDAARSQTEKEVVITAEKSDMKVRIRICDFGRIAREHRDRLFEPFFSTKSGGTGLGLSISRQMIEGNGGSLSLDDKSADTTFIIELPLPDRADAGKSEV